MYVSGCNVSSGSVGLLSPNHFADRSSLRKDINLGSQRHSRSSHNVRSFIFALLDLPYTFDESSLGFNATTSKSQISNYKLQVILRYEFSIDMHVTLCYFIGEKKVNVIHRYRQLYSTSIAYFFR